MLEKLKFQQLCLSVIYKQNILVSLGSSYSYSVQCRRGIYFYIYSMGAVSQLWNMLGS